jgi:hypothetical protein
MKIVILNWQRPLWEGDQEVVKRIGENEPIWSVTHICMVTTLGISLYESSKNAVFLIISYVFSSTKSEQEGRKGSAWKLGIREGDPNNVYTCM